MDFEEQKKARKRERNKRYQENLKTRMLTLSDQKKVLKNDDSDLSWSSVEEFLMTPKILTLFFLTTVFTSFLLWQSTLFFLGSGLNMTESIVFSVIGEALFLCSAAFLFLGESRKKKFISLFIFTSSFVALVLFLHHGATSHANTNSPEYTTQKTILDGLRRDLSDLRRARGELPQGHVTKSLEIQKAIENKTTEELKIVLSLAEIEKGGLKAGEMYLSWLRIAALLVNLLLVHTIVQSFVLRPKRKGIFLCQ
jgi:hypothetical protein